MTDLPSNRRTRRLIQRRNQKHLNKLATLLGRFYEFLSKKPRPSDEDVRKRFAQDNSVWQKYCLTHQLINATHLFSTNVREAWEKHKTKS